MFILVDSYPELDGDLMMKEFDHHSIWLDGMSFVCSQLIVKHFKDNCFDHYVIYSFNAMIEYCIYYVCCMYECCSVHVIVVVHV
jgi:hypothetical protein